MTAQRLLYLYKKHASRSVLTIVWVAGLAALPLVGCSSSPDLPLQPDPRAEAVYTPQQGDYRLVPGDEVKVDFLYHRALNTDAVVLVDGGVTVEGLGEFYASGQTTTELQKEIFRRASLTHRDPLVSVSLVERQGYRAYVGGEVKRPGYVDVVPGLTSMRAIFARGGFLDTAKTNNVLHVRWDDNGDYTATLVDLQTALENGDVRNDIAMGPNDVVFVPKTRIANANLWVSQYILKLIPIRPPTTKFPEFGGPWGDNNPD